MSYQDTYSQLPPGLDPANLARLAQQFARQGAISRQAQAAGLPPDQPPPQQPQQPPQQEAKADTGDTTTEPSTKPEAEPVAEPAAEPAAEPPPDTEAAPAPTRVASIDPLTGRFALPQLQRRNEPYVPVSARSPRELGGDWWPIQAFALNPDIQYGPFMPAPQEVYGIIRGVGAQMAQWGAPSYGQYYGQASIMATSIGPVLDALTGGRFSRGFNAARLGALRVQQEQMKLNLQQALVQHQEFLDGARKILDFYAYGGEEGDEAKAKETAEHKMEDYLNQTGHQNLINMLHTRGMKGVVEYLTYEDQKYRDGLAAHTSLKRATGASDEEKDRAFEGGGAAADPNSPEARRERAGTFGADKAVDPLAPKTPTLGASGDLDADIKRAFPGTTDREIEAARTVAGGGKAPDVGRVKKARIEGIAEGLKAAVERIPRGAGSTEDKLKRIETIDPSTADKVRGLLDYSLDPEKDIPAAKDERARLTSLAHALNPNWKSGTYRLVQKYHDPSSSEGVRVQRVSSLDGALWSLNNVLSRMDEAEKVPPRVLQAWIAGNYSGDPKWDELYTAIRDIATDTIAIQTGSGRPAVTLVNKLVAHMLPSASPAQIRAQVLVDMRGAYGQVVTLRDQYRSEIGDPNAELPFYGHDVGDKYNAYLRMNPYTGEMPVDAPSSLLATSKKPNLKNLPSWIQRTTAERPGQELPPLTKMQIREGWDRLDELNKLGTPEAQKQAQWLRIRLGIFADRGSL